MSKDKPKTKTIKVDYLARVEGEGALFVKYDENKVHDVKLKIFEPPRFFEAFLRGRDYTEAPDITARICGICPVAYQMSAVHAMEDALDIEIEPGVRQLRRLLYCGEWLESHLLHIYMLHAPDFLGYESSVHLAKDHPEIVKRGLRMKKIGNSIVSTLGGREVHPINVRVGGFYRIPKKKDFEALLEDLKWGRDAAIETVRWAAGLNIPELERDYIFVATSHAEDYPFNEGRIGSSQGLDIAKSEFLDHFEEEHIEHTNALHCRLKKSKEAYFVGPMARFNLHFDKLSALTKEIAKEVGLAPVCKNPFQSILVRSLESLYAYDEAIRIIENFERPDKPAADFELKAGEGHGCTEAPRGMLYHRYRINEQGKIEDAVIVPPTSQNQKTIENDLEKMIPNYMHLSEEELTWQCEQAIRNYDPCISCATHFLNAKFEKVKA